MLSLSLQEYVLQELLSPIVTPFLLCFHLRYKSLDIVDFFRNFTVDVVGVGDVCSFAQMDVKRHGNPEVNICPYSHRLVNDLWYIWESLFYFIACKAVLIVSVKFQWLTQGLTEATQYEQAEHGKTELSLVQFSVSLVFFGECFERQYLSLHSSTNSVPWCCCFADKEPYMEAIRARHSVH